MEPVYWIKLVPNANAPIRGSPFAAGWDISALEACILQPGERKLLPTGLGFQIPPNYYGRLADRSSMALNYGLHVLAGVIDADYR